METDSNDRNYNINTINNKYSLDGVAEVCDRGKPNQTTLGCVEPFSLEDSGIMNSYSVPIYGYATPFVVVITLITNILVCIVLLMKHMRTPTNYLLTVMAISDTLTGVLPLPCFLYFYSWERYREWVSFDWCFAYVCLTDYLPTIFHTAAIWLTVALAVQRYIYVCRLANTKKWCTLGVVTGVVMIIYAVAIVSQVSRFVETVYEPVRVRSRVEPGRIVTSCARPLRHFILVHQIVYYNIYYWFRVLAMHLIPCIILILLNVLLIRAMRSAQLRRRILLKQNQRSESRCLKESNRTTMMLVTVVGLFLIVEFPMAVFLILSIAINTFDVPFVDWIAISVTSLLLNFLIMLSYPLNFFIYCYMSRQFRQTFRLLVTRGSMMSWRANSTEQQTQWYSLQENGGARRVSALAPLCDAGDAVHERTTLASTER